MGRVDRTDRGGMYMEEFAGLGSSVWSLSLQNWARDGNGARSFCVCVWSCRSWNRKLHLLWTFTISIGGKETLSDIMKWRIKLEGHFVPIVAAEVRCSLDLQHLGPCAAPHEPAVLWCGRVSQHFGIAFKIDAKKKKKSVVKYFAQGSECSAITRLQGCCLVLPGSGELTMLFTFYVAVVGS